jgi:hypothetical protein
MSAFTTLEQRVDSTCRLLLMLYPTDWQHIHGDEARALLVSRAMDRGGRIGFTEAVDLVWHATLARLDSTAAPMLSRLPRSTRTIPAMITLAISAISSVILIAGEILGAAHRPANPPYQLMFISGPFQTIGVGIYIGFIISMTLLLAHQVRAARLVVLATTVLAIWMTYPAGLQAYPQPPTAYTASFSLLGIASLIGLDDKAEYRPRTRAAIGSATAVASAVGIVLCTILSSRYGWLPHRGTTSWATAVVAYAAAAVAILIAVFAAVLTAIRHRQFGGLLLVMMVAVGMTGLHAIAALVGSDPPTAWIWFIASLIIIGAGFSLLRRWVDLPRQPSAH